MAANYNLTVFIPLHNEEGAVPYLITKIDLGISLINVTSAEIILVDDGSTDNTLNLLRKVQSKNTLKIIHHRKRLGLTRAMKSGFRQAQGEYLIFLPGDLQSDPSEDIPILYNKLKESFDIVAGFRQHRKDGKVFSSKIYNFVSRKLFNLNLHDMNWIKGFRREVIENIELRSDWHRYILMLAADEGFSITEVPVNWYPRQGGKSKYGLGRIPVSILDLLSVKFLLVFRKKPMVFFGTIAFSLMLAGFVICCALAGLWLWMTIQIRPFLQLAFFLLLSGIIIIMVGLLAEQIASLQEKIDKLEDLITKQ